MLGVTRIGVFFDLRSVFRNSLLRRIAEDYSFVYWTIWKRVKDVSALCKKRSLPLLHFVK